LPPLQSSTSALTTLGTLYKVKGDLLVYQDPAAVDGWYRKALETLARALPIDRAYSQERQRRELARGWGSERIEVKGYGALYKTLSDTYRALGRLPEAIDALQHLVRIRPLDAERYAQLAELEAAAERTEDSVVSLWMAEKVSPSPEWELRLANAYHQRDPAGCAGAKPSAVTPDRDCPMVKAHICSAQRRLIAVLSETGRADAAGRYRLEAARTNGCTPFQ